MKPGFFILLFIVLLYGCKNNLVNNNTDEGVITYDVSYFDSEKDNPIITLLPNKIELRFKNNNISLVSEGYLGLFSTKFISIYETENSNILLKVLNNKFNYEFPKDEIAFIYNQLPPNKIEVLDSVKIIAGYECKLAKLSFEDKNCPSITICYTNEIGLAKPNRNTPLHKLNGVLLEFESTMNQVNAKFTATKVSLKPVEDKEFIIPDDYKKSDLATLQKYIVDFN
ncbi:hypothetical protein ACT3CE_08775 [Marinifilum sp. RC60d5]|uniref:hypothetical protein n=1 Tax=Marinifilum sp. RC60d5 TaxID=3458414 RepID=UPI004036835F